MNGPDVVSRWPPVYDFNELGQQINKLIESREIFETFYYREGLDAILCQGDVINFAGLAPYIDQDGDISSLDEEYDFWLILGNTCDLQRIPTRDKINNFPPFSHITPLIPIPTDAPDEIVNGLRTYNSYKKFFVPSWENSSRQEYIVDFTLICSVDKVCLNSKAIVTARLTQKSWVLLHSCLVRYLARDDGRHD